MFSCPTPSGVFDAIVEDAEGRLVEGRDYLLDREKGTLTMFGVTLERRVRVTVFPRPSETRRFSVLPGEPRRVAQWKRETNRRFR